MQGEGSSHHRLLSLFRFHTVRHAWLSRAVQRRCERRATERCRGQALPVHSPRRVSQPQRAGIDTCQKAGRSLLDSTRLHSLACVCTNKAAIYALALWIDTREC